MEYLTQAPNLIVAARSVSCLRHLLGAFIDAILVVIFVSFGFVAPAWAVESGAHSPNELIEQFRNPDRNISYEASRKLIQRGESVVPELLTLLYDLNPEIRSRAAWTLGAIGPTAVEAVPNLIALLKNSDEKEFVLHNAAEALSLIGPVAIGDLLQAMKSSNIRTRYFITSSIGMMQDSARPVLLKFLKHDDPEIGRFAAVILSAGGYEAETVIPSLMDIIANKELDKDIRSAASDFMGRYGESAQVASKLLLAVTLDRTESLDVRNPAILSLGLIHPSPEEVVGPLINLLQSAEENELVRRNTAKALGKIGEPSDEISPVLLRIINDRRAPSAVRGGAALGLSYMKTSSAAAVLELIEMLKDDDFRIRKEAMAALQIIPPRGEKADVDFSSKLPFFRQWIDSGSREQKMMAIVAIAHMGPSAETEIPKFLKLMNLKEEPGLRRAAIRAAGYISRGNPNVTDALAIIIRSEKEDIPLRALAMNSLGQTGPEAVAALWDLADLFEEEQPKVLQEAFGNAVFRAEPKNRKLIPEIIDGLDHTSQNLREVAALFLWVLAKNIYPEIGELGLAELTRLTNGLQKARIIFNESDASQTLLNFFGRMDDTYAKELEFRKGDPFVKVISWCYQHKAITGIFIYLVFMPAMWAIILWVSPLSILKINHAITPVKDIKLSGWLGSLNLPIRLALMVRPFLYHRRVMDAWVGLHADTVFENFSGKQTVKDRAVFVNMPVVLDGSTIASLSAGDIRAVFRKQRARLLIWGEGGSGKTSLACQIAIWALSEDSSRRICNHRMLPILIEHDLGGDGENEKNDVLRAIRGQVDDLVGRTGSISEEFLKNLLMQRRLLVIVDHLSEMTPGTRSLIRPELPDFYANALIVTSRIDEELGGVTRSICKPMRISGDRLSSFMEAYFTQRGVRERFNDAEFFEGCQKLSAMVKERQITALMAKLFAEQMIRSKEGGEKDDLPSTVPDLMLSYLNELYHNASCEELRSVQRDAKIVAWKCLEGHLRPAAADYSDVVQALGPESVEARLKILERDLRLIATIGAAQDKIRFNLDPLAEHLAAQFLVDTYKEDEAFWRSFIERIDTMLIEADAIREFILALHECWMVKGMHQRYPDMTEKLNSLREQSA